MPIVVKSVTFEARLLEETKVSEIVTWPRSHIISDIPTKRIWT